MIAIHGSNWQFVIICSTQKGNFDIVKVIYMLEVYLLDLCAFNNSVPLINMYIFFLPDKLTITKLRLDQLCIYLALMNLMVVIGASLATTFIL